MSEFEIRELIERIDAGILLAQRRLLERTRRNDDYLVVMRDGEIVERGKHEELLALGGVYKKLNDMQSL